MSNVECRIKEFFLFYLLKRLERSDIHNSIRLRRINHHLSFQFHISVAAGRERPVKSNEKLMNVEHRTYNVEHRIMYSVYFKKTERSDSTIRQSSIIIRHSSFISGRGSIIGFKAICFKKGGGSNPDHCRNYLCKLFYLQDGAGRSCENDVQGSQSKR